MPIYLGASNIKEFIPENTFIDKNRFGSYEELYSFIIQIDDKSYGSYLKNIEDYIKSKKARLFSAENFAETLINYIIKE